MTSKTGLDVLKNALEVGTSTVHLVNEGNTRHVVLVSLTPNSLRLRLNTVYSGINHYSAVKNTHGTLYFNGKVHVARGINNVDAERLSILIGHTAPEAGCSC